MTPALATRSDLTVSTGTTCDVEAALPRDLEAWVQRWDAEPAALQHLVEGAVSGTSVDTAIGAEARADLARIVERAGRALLAR